jgi:hypothetical protein
MDAAADAGIAVILRRQGGAMLRFGRRRGTAQAALAVSVCVLGVVVAAAPALAAPAWLAPVDVSADHSAMLPQIAVDRQGNATAVWERFNGVAQITQAAVRPAGGGWQPPHDLTPAGEQTAGAAVAADGQGDVTAVWSTLDAGQARLRSAVHPAAGDWQPTADVFPPDLSASRNPHIAIDAQGSATVVWESTVNGQGVVRAAVRPAGGVWQPPVDVSAVDASIFGPGATGQQVAVGPQGSAVAVWQRWDGSNYIVQAAVRSAGSWQPPVDLSAPGQDATAPRVAVDPQGNAIAIWQRSNGDATFRVQSAARPSGGGWEAPVDVTDPGESAGAPQIALDDQGDATAVWRGGSSMRSALHPAGGAWQPPSDVSSPGETVLGSPEVAVDAQGNATAVWRRTDNFFTFVRAARRPPAAAWQPAVDLSGPSGFGMPFCCSGQFAAVDGQGEVTVVWEQLRGVDKIIQAAGYDAAGPQMRGLSVPATGVVGQPVTMSVAPLDVWSALGETTWSFGDGATASGPAVRHTYTLVGDFPVGISALDALANAGTATRTIRIVAPPPVPPLRISALRVSPTAFRPAGSGGAVQAARTRTGTRVSYALDRPATVRFRVERVAGGRRVGGRCVAGTSTNRGHKSCARYAFMVGSFSRHARAGTDHFTFTGRLALRALKPGRYRLRATPTAAGRTARAATASLRITGA